MSFFKKLKNKLFKSSSKIDEGLDAIVSEGAEPELTAVEDTVAEQAEMARVQAEAEAKVEAQRLADEEAARLAQEEASRIAAQAEAQAQAERAAAEAAAEDAARNAERVEQELAAVAAAKAEAAAEAERLAQMSAAAEAEAEAHRVEAHTQDAAAQAEIARQAEVARLACEAEAVEAALLVEQAQAAEAERLAQAARAEEQRQSEEAQAELEARAEAARQAERLAEIEREAEAERQAEIAEREAEAARQAQLSAREAVVAPMTTLEPSVLGDEGASEPEQKKGLLGRLFGRDQTVVPRRTLDDDMLEQLEELLIGADMGADTALRVTANMAEGRFGKKLSVAEIKDLLAAEITRIMEPVAKPMPLYPTKPQVVLVVGVNGSGKTTTIGKLASQFKAAGKSVVIAAGDTFRAAAVEQLQVWGERAGVPVLTAPEGSDPASLAFDAMTKAQADGADLLMIDTAGRLQNRADLMEELAKIVRVIRKKDPDAPHNTLLVLDATTGQNALLQVDIFRKIADVSGLVMTKLDGTAKGGVLVALADKFGLPIHAIGVGEQIDDLAPFDPQEFAEALVGVQA